MNKNNDKSRSKKLLDKLQEELGQLELLIFGFIIFGLFYVKEFLGILKSSF